MRANAGFRQARWQTSSVRDVDLFYTPRFFLAHPESARTAHIVCGRPRIKRKKGEVNNPGTSTFCVRLKGAKYMAWLCRQARRTAQVGHNSVFSRRPGKHRFQEDIA